MKNQLKIFYYIFKFLKIVKYDAKKNNFYELKRPNLNLINDLAYFEEGDLKKQM